MLALIAFAQGGRTANAAILPQHLTDLLAGSTDDNLQHEINQNTFITLYKTLVRSNLEYVLTHYGILIKTRYRGIRKTSDESYEVSNCTMP